MEKIVFINDGIHYRIPNKKRIRQICVKLSQDYQFILRSLNIVLTTDASLQEINKNYLKKNHLTDIISFNYSEAKTEIDGELYISMDRIRENAKVFSKNIENELFRVIFHGLLHLVGEDDNNSANLLKMRQMEDFYLNLCFT